MEIFCFGWKKIPKAKVGKGTYRLKYGVIRRCYGGDTKKHNIYHYGHTNPTTNINVNDRYIFDKTMLTKYVDDGHLDISIQRKLNA